jgi:hypothetical protein
MMGLQLRPLGLVATMLAVLGVTACAPQRSTASATPAPASQMSLGAPPSAAPPGAASQGPSAPGVQRHGGSGMDMQSMMAHCAQMRQQQAQGTRLSPEMQGMMAHCDEMDRAHGAAHRH